jgi:hypothetical protein
MPLIMNATDETVQVKALGNWFSFNPGQIKVFEDKIAHFIATERKEKGLVDLPDEFMDPAYAQTPEGAKLLADKKKDGVEAYCNHLRWLIRNNEVSLRRDLERANMKIAPELEASEGEMKAYELLAKYQSKKQDETQKKLDRVSELKKAIKEK